MTLVVLWINSTRGFTLITLLFRKNSPWNSVEMCRMTLAVLWIKYTLGFILITLLVQEKCPWDSVEMCSMTLVVLWTNSTHGYPTSTKSFHLCASEFFMDQYNSTACSSTVSRRCPFYSVSCTTTSLGDSMISFGRKVMVTNLLARTLFLFLLFEISLSFRQIFRMFMAMA